MDERGAWRIRPAITAAIGLVGALILQRLLDRNNAQGVVELATWRIALATAVGVAAVLAIFTLDRVRMGWAIGFAAAFGAVAGLVTWWSGPGPAGGGDWFWDWRTACLFIAIAIAAPLFQAAREAGRARFAYVEVHGHVWTNIVLWCAGCGFTGIAFALAHLLAELFGLIGIHLLRDLLRNDWANAMLAGAAFGGAVGLLRERDRVVRTLQRVVTAILGVLAPVLGVGLLLFLAALPFTGLGALWEATKQTTPILLACAIGAWVLANAVIGDGEMAGEDDETANPALRWGAMALGLAMLPLAVIAAVATGLRIGQYGFTPDRLWALTFVIVACAYGLAYLVALARRRQGWADDVRPANLTLAFGAMGIALLLATPLVSFNAISTRDQVARLESGRTTADTFDWRALAFEFGAPGRAALERLKRSANPAVARLAQEAGTKTNRYEVTNIAEEARLRDTIEQRMRILPAAVPLSPGLRGALVDYDACGQDKNARCTLIYRPGETEAIVFQHACIAELARDSARVVDTECRIAQMKLAGGKWAVQTGPLSPERDAATRAAIVAGLNAGAVDVRPVTRRQVFIGGHPVGDVFE